MSVDTGRREATKAANRAQILQAARQVFSDLGYGATTVRDIVRGTELASGTFYNYFPDKESVFRALVDDFSDEARARVRAARAAAASPSAFVEDSYRAYFEFIVEDPDRFEFLVRNAGTIRFLFGEAALGAGAQDLREDLEQAMAAERIPALDADYLSHTMMAVGVELGMRLIERRPPDVDGATAFATELFLGGLARLSGAGRVA